MFDEGRGDCEEERLFEATKTRKARQARSRRNRERGLEFEEEMFKRRSRYLALFLTLNYKPEYGNVSHMGIQALITHLNKNISQLSKDKPQGVIFNFKTDHTVVKCIQANKAGDQLDIILLNNISHGHFQPTKPTLDGVLRNIQPLLEWAYK